jgi:hypothetical protein
MAAGDLVVSLIEMANWPNGGQDHRDLATESETLQVRFVGVVVCDTRTTLTVRLRHKA